MSSSSNVVQLPTEQEVEEAKLSCRTLSKYADADRVQLSIKGSNNQSDELVLPGHALQLLLDVLSEMSRGNAISIIPIHAELSTQEAANMLNVSRPFLVGLLEKGEINFHKVGTHRRVLAKDVIDYKQKIDTERTATLDRLTEESQKLGMGYE
jgi:excisionase family DNA binding protein